MRGATRIDQGQRVGVVRPDGRRTGRIESRVSAIALDAVLDHVEQAALGRRAAEVRVAEGNRPVVLRTIGEPQPVILLVFEVAEDVEALLVEVAVAVGQAAAILARVTVLHGLAERDIPVQPLNLALDDHVDNAGNGVGAVGGRCAVEQHVDAIDDRFGNRVDVDEVAVTVVAQRIERRTHAVEQRQRVGVIQAAQRRGAGAGREAERGPARLGRAGVVGAEGLESLGNGRHAAGLQVFRRDRDDRRRGRRGRVARDRAGDHDRPVVGRRALCGRPGTTDPPDWSCNRRRCWRYPARKLAR